MKKTLITFTYLTFIFGSSYLFANDFSYEIKIKPAGDFNIQIKENFTNIKLDKVLDLKILNEKAQIKSDDSLKSVTLSKTINAQKIEKVNYASTVKAKHSGVTATINSSCTLDKKASSFISYCKITNSKAPLVGGLFEYGSTEITCAENNSKINCTTKILGKAKSINIPFKKRSSARLAVSGSAQTLRSLYKLYTLTAHNSTESFSDYFYNKNISPYWNLVISHLENEQVLKNNLLITSNPNRINIKYE